MINARRLVASVLLLLILLISLLPLADTNQVLANPSSLEWTVVDTPSAGHNVVVTPSEVNAIAVGSSRVIYAIDIPHSKVYKSTDDGATWEDGLTNRLVAAGAGLPAWDIAVAPDNPNMVAAVTNNRTKVYLTFDGGDNWEDGGILTGLLISDITFSPIYTAALGETCDIAIGTRNPDGAANGDVWTMQITGTSGWQAQLLGRDVTTIRFSPNYEWDKTILVIASDLTGTYLHHGTRVPTANTTFWDVPAGYPVELKTGTDTSPTESQIITSDMALPSDYVGIDPNSRRAYVCYDSRLLASGDDAYRVDNTTLCKLSVTIIPPPTAPGIASIAYCGTYDSGKLLAAEARTDATKASARVWLCLNPEAPFPQPQWEQPPAKPPTGGAGSGYANAQIAWSSSGAKAYCGTATAYLTNAADWANMALPAGPWRGDQFDENAFSVTIDDNNTWNQLSLIDTEITFLSDVSSSADSKVLYLASINSNAGTNGFDSLWRSESEPLGTTWQRICCVLSTNDDLILRVSPEVTKEDNLKVTGKVIFFADVGTRDLYCSTNKGQLWFYISPGINITDFNVNNDGLIYVLSNYYVRRGTSSGTIWDWAPTADTKLGSGHNITSALKNPKDKNYVIVGDAGNGEVAYSADGGAGFTKTRVVPVPGNMHVVTDEDFKKNKTIYAASDGLNGKIYRWVIDTSEEWIDITAPNQQFYGLTQDYGTLYGAWSDITQTPNSGVNRALEPTTRLPRPVQWDNLTENLNNPVLFTREPTSLKSSNKVDLWAIDDQNYNFPAEIGCLWNYRDALLAGPWATSPAIGELISVDPPTGRAEPIIFKWRQLSTARQYELWIAKDEQCTTLVTQQHIIPEDPTDPAWVLLPETIPLEAGKTYYWKVRVERADPGNQFIHSPWSVVMNFIVKGGVPITAPYAGSILISPANGATRVQRSPAFSWTPMPGTTEYEFILAKDAALTQTIVKKELSNTAYQYDDKLDWDTTYFWAVKVIKPVPSKTYSVATFSVMTKEEAALEQPLAPTTPLWAKIVIAFTIVFILAITTFNPRVRQYFKHLIHRVSDKIRGRERW